MNELSIIINALRDLLSKQSGQTRAYKRFLEQFRGSGKTFMFAVEDDNPHRVLVTASVVIGFLKESASLWNADQSPAFVFSSKFIMEAGTILWTVRFNGFAEGARVHDMREQLVALKFLFEEILHMPPAESLPEYRQLAADFAECGKDMSFVNEQILLALRGHDPDSLCCNGLAERLN